MTSPSSLQYLPDQWKRAFNHCSSCFITVMCSRLSLDNNSWRVSTQLYMVLWCHAISQESDLVTRLKLATFKTRQQPYNYSVNKIKIAAPNQHCGPPVQRIPCWLAEEIPVGSPWGDLKWEGLTGSCVLITANRYQRTLRQYRVKLKKLTGIYRIIKDCNDVLHSCVHCDTDKLRHPEFQTPKPPFIWKQPKVNVLYLINKTMEDDSPVLFAAWCRWESFWDGLSFRSNTSDVTHVAPFMDTAVHVTPTLLGF